MAIGTIIYYLVELGIFIYMLGVGYQFFPDPGKSGSEKNKEHFDKYRKVFKIGGIAGIIYVLFSVAQEFL